MSGKVQRWLQILLTVRAIRQEGSFSSGEILFRLCPAGSGDIAGASVGKKYTSLPPTTGSGRMTERGPSDQRKEQPMRERVGDQYKWRGLPRTMSAVTGPKSRMRLSKLLSRLLR